MSDDRPLRSALSPEQYARMTEVTSGREREGGHFVVLGVQWNPPSAETVKAFAEGLGYDPYMARQRLLAPCPRVLRREEHRQKAEEWVAWLVDTGLAGFAVSEERIAGFAPWPAASASHAGEILSFVHDDGTVRRIPNADVRCIVVGRVQRRTTQHKTGADIAGFFQPGTTDVLSSSVEGVIDVHTNEPGEAVRLLENSLKFGGMSLEHGDGRARMRQVADFLAKAVPGAPVIDDFARASAALGESCQIVARSLDIDYRPAGAPMPRVGLAKSRTVEQSDASAFDLYSLLSSLQLQRC